jgi:hypothetical protein
MPVVRNRKEDIGRKIKVKAGLYLKVSQRKKGSHGSSERTLVYQVQGPEFKPQ